MLLPGENKEKSPPSDLGDTASVPEDVAKAHELVFLSGICLWLSDVSLPKLTPFCATLGERKYEQLVDLVIFKGWCPEF